MFPTKKKFLRGCIIIDHFFPSSTFSWTHFQHSFNINMFYIGRKIDKLLIKAKKETKEKIGRRVITFRFSSLSIGNNIFNVE